jgi:hypothetical protein
MAEEQPKHREVSDEKARAIVQEFSNWVNDFCHHNTAFVEAVMDQHRTLQQRIFETFLACMDAWSKLPEHGYDLRNQFTVEKSREILALFPGGPRVPLI